MQKTMTMNQLAALMDEMQSEPSHIENFHYYISEWHDEIITMLQGKYGRTIQLKILKVCLRVPSFIFTKHDIKEIINAMEQNDPMLFKISR